LQPYISPYELKERKPYVAIKPKAGRPRVRTDEERRVIRNECALRNYYENRELRLQQVKEYYQKNREEIIRKNIERAKNERQNKNTL
jgi:hypothetical protein